MKSLIEKGGVRERNLTHLMTSPGGYDLIIASYDVLSKITSKSNKEVTL